MGSIVKPESTSDVIAAFDLGSNSIKMTVARIQATPRQVDEFLWRSETVRLGLGVDKTGSLLPDRIDAAIDTLQRFSSEARTVGATRLVGVATEAVRIAANGESFLRILSEELGIEIQVISGDREAELTFLGLHGVVDLSGKVVVADIGGGSTELVMAIEEQVGWSTSYPLGSGRLTEQFVLSDPPTAEELSNCRAFARTRVRDAPFDKVIEGRLIVVGGTGEYIDRLIEPNDPHRTSTLDNVLNRLASVSAAELAVMIDIAETRARVLPAGVAIAAAVADAMRPVQFEVAQSGIRRGLLLSAIAGEV